MKSKSNLFILSLILIFGAIAFVISVDTFFRNQSITKSLLQIQETKHLLSQVQIALDANDPDLIYEASFSLKSMAEIPRKGNVGESHQLLNESVTSLQDLNKNQLERTAKYSDIRGSIGVLQSAISKHQKEITNADQIDELDGLYLMIDAEYGRLNSIYNNHPYTSLAEEAVFISDLQEDSRQSVAANIPKLKVDYEKFAQDVDAFLGAEIAFQASLEEVVRKTKAFDMQINHLFQEKLEAGRDLNKFAILGLILTLTMTSIGLFLLLRKLENATERANLVDPIEEDS